MTDSTDTAGRNARSGDELLPFLNNFHDIFTTMGVFILLGGLGAGMFQVMSTLGLDEDSQTWQYVFMALTAAIGLIVWFLSAILVGSQRRILPGIVLSSAFTMAASSIIMWAYGQYLMNGAGMNEEAFEPFMSSFDSMEFEPDAVNGAWNALPASIQFMPIVVILASLIPIAVYYMKFRLPYAGGVSGVYLVALAVAALFMVDPYSWMVNAPTVLVAGSGALLLGGILFDMRDPDRTTRLSGTAFWLHLFSAPVLLFSVLLVTQVGWTLDGNDFANPEQFNMLGSFAENDDNSIRLAVTALSVIGVFALVSLLINRRALIVSGLLTAGVSISVIINAVGLETGAVVAVTLLVLGGAVVLLGAAWNPVRRILLAPFPNGGPIARIFPPANGTVG
jgi:hypothetical protein